MNDLTKIDRPIGELPDLLKWALVGAYNDNRTIEVRNDSGGWDTIVYCKHFAKDRVYRLQPTPPREFWIDMCNPDYARIKTEKPRCPGGYIHVREVAE